MKRSSLDHVAAGVPSLAVSSGSLLRLSRSFISSAFDVIEGNQFERSQFGRVLLFVRNCFRLKLG